LIGNVPASPEPVHDVGSGLGIIFNDQNTHVLHDESWTLPE
jgi:hypothetical protein